MHLLRLAGVRILAERAVWGAGSPVRRSKAIGLKMKSMAAASSHDHALPAADSSLRTLRALFLSSRPGQWAKNLVLGLPFLFGRTRATSRGWALPADSLLVFCAITGPSMPI